MRKQALASVLSIYVYVRTYAMCGWVVPELLSTLPKLAISHVVDNSALPHLTVNVGVSAKTEHFLLWQHILRYLVVHGWLRIHLCITGDMLADPLTKVTYRPAYNSFRKEGRDEPLSTATTRNPQPINQRACGGLSVSGSRF